MKQLTLSPKQEQFLKSPFIHTLEVLEGTPRSGKTTVGHLRYARYLIETEDTNHLIVAYNQEQAYRLFIDGDGTGLKHIFGSFAKDKMDKKLGQYLEITTHKGIRKVFYRGGGKSNDVGAITGMSLGSVVFCEINLLNMGMIQECFRRTFAAKNRFHMADLNPPSPQHPVISKVFDVQDTKWTHWTPHDNPILNDKRKKEIYDVLSKSDYLLQRDWYGKRIMPQGVIYSMFNQEENTWETIQGRICEMYFTADGGQSDATTCGCYVVVYHEGNYKLLNVATYYHSGADTGEIKAMSVYAKELKEFMNWCESELSLRSTNVFVDPACKSLREELHLLGIQTKGANNNAKDVKGSSKGIEVGIERVQNSLTNRQLLFINLSDKYGHLPALKEISMYIRLDNGKPIDDYNHFLDSLRYSVNYFYKNYIL